MDWSPRAALLIVWIALVLSTIGDSNGEERIVCYYTNWSVYRPGTAKYSPQNINPYLCTHLIYAFGGFTKDNTLKPFDKYQDIEKGGYAKFTGLKTYNKNLKTMLAIGGWNEGSSRFSPMVADPSRRKELVKNAVKFLRQNHFDGLDLDWEYPAFRDGGKPRDKNNYASLVQELREEFERESLKTGRTRLLLSMAIPAGIEYLEKGYDLPRLNEYLDFFNLLSYDYHSAFEPAVNHHAPLYGLEEDNEYNYDSELTIDYTVKYLLNHDVTSEKLVLGIPTYGRSYTLYNAEANEIGAPADGPGEEGDATREKGYLAYYEICENIAKSDEWEVVQPNEKAMGPYAFRDNQWVGYDDESIVRVKALYVRDNKLGGIMFWSIDNDDFRGKCHGRPYPLIEAAKEALLTGNKKSSAENSKTLANRKKGKPLSSQRTTDTSNDRKYSSSQQRPGKSNRKRPGNSRFSNRHSTRNFRGDEEDDEEAEDPEERNTVRNRKRPSRNGTRRKTQHTRKIQKTNKNSADDGKSLSLTTPEPPTTPDPGSDFKCEEDGFFPHPRDCKKYFWCLDAGPGGLGIVAHQFTCPSGLVFNKASDSCDYPRNVVCPKAKPATTAAPTTTTVRTTPKRRTTTAAPESEEEDEYEYDDDIEEEEEEEEIPISTTAKPLLYKTISRARPTTTTEASTTERTTTSTTESPKNIKEAEGESDIDDTEDPRVLKELIDLIKKAGGIEQLEKQLHLQEKNSANEADTTKANGQATPATISRSLYEKVLNRQANRLFGTSTARTTTSRVTDSRNTFQNGPGRAQFEGLDDVPEVRGLRRNKRPQYVTIERHRSSTPVEEDDRDDDEIEDPAGSSENESASSIEEKETRSPLRRVTPNYVNIQRPRPTTPASENDVEEKEEAEDTRIPHYSLSTEAFEETSQEPTSQRSRYTNVQRFRSTTSKPLVEFEEAATSPEYSVENPTKSTFSQETTSTLEPQSFTTHPSSSSEPTTEELKAKTELLDDDMPTISTTHLPATEPAKSVENSVTELLLTTFPALSSPRTTSSPILRPTTSAVSPPRPFGFPRRTRPTSTTTTSLPVSTTSEQTRAKVSTRPTRNFARSSNAYQNRVRTRTRSTTVSNDIVGHSLEENSNEVTSVEPEKQTINRSRFVSRRGGSRFTVSSRVTTEEAPKKRVGTSEEVPTSAFPSRRRGRPTPASESPSSVFSRRRRPTDSRIIRISTESPNLSKKSKLIDIEKDDQVKKITKIEVFKTPEDLSNIIEATDVEKETAASTIQDDFVTSTTVSSITDVTVTVTESTDTNTITTDEAIATTVDDRLFLDNTPEPIEKDDKKALRRKVLLRKRPVSTTPEPPTEGKRWRKILKRVRPLPEESSNELPTASDGEVLFSSRYRGKTTSLLPQEQDITTDNPTSLAATETTEQTTVTSQQMVESTTIPTTLDVWTTDFVETTLQTENPQEDENLLEATTQIDVDESTTVTTPVLSVNLEISGLPTLKQLINTNDYIPTSSIDIKPTSSYTISNSLYDELDNDQLLPQIIRNDGVQLPVKILDNGSGEVNINHPFAVLNLPKGVINPNLTSTILKIEIINSGEIKVKSQEETVGSGVLKDKEIQENKVTNPRSTRRRDRSRQQTSNATNEPNSRRRNARRRGNARATASDATEVVENLSPTIPLVTNPSAILKPTTLRGSLIPLPKSEGPPKGFFITKSLNGVTAKIDLNIITTEMPATTILSETTTIRNEETSTENLPKETTQILDWPSNEVDSVYSTTLHQETTEAIDSSLPTTLRPVETTQNANGTEYTDTISTKPDLTTFTEREVETTVAMNEIRQMIERTTASIMNFSSETTTYDNFAEKLQEFNFTSGESTEKYSTSESYDITAATTPVNFSTLENDIVDETNDTIQPVFYTTESLFYTSTEEMNTEQIVRSTTVETPMTTDAPEFIAFTAKIEQTSNSTDRQQSDMQNSTTSSYSQSSEASSTSEVSLLTSSIATTSSTAPTTSTTSQFIEQRRRTDIRRSRGKIRYGSQTTTSVPVERKSRPISSYRRRTTTHSSNNKTDSSPVTPNPIITSISPRRRPFNRGRGQARGRQLAISTTEQSFSATEIPDGATSNNEDNGQNALSPKSSQSQPIDDQSLAESSHSDFLGEVGGLKNSGIFSRRPGSFHRPSTTRSSTNVDETSERRYSSKFTTPKSENDDQSGRAQEITVSVIDPTVLAAFDTGNDTSTYRGGQKHRVQEFRGLTETPLAKATVRPRRRQRPTGEIKQRVTPSRPRRPPIVDYDYYVDEEVRVAVKPELKDKIYVTSSGRIGCLDQGTFAHPYSCKKFITCAKMVGGQVVPTEYSCPNKLSFDPVGGICNWSAGLGCKETLH